MEIITHLAQALGYVLVAMIILLAVYKLTNLKQKNMALSLRQGGLFLGSSIALFGVLHGSSRGFLIDIQMIFLYGVFSTIGILLSLVVNNYLILPRMNNKNEILNNNKAVGFTEFGTALATGLIMMGAMTGDGSLLTAFVFFLLGQIVLVGITYIYELITPYNTVNSIKNGNVSAGIMLGGIQIAMGILLSHAVTGDFVNWSHDLTAFLVSAASGIVLISLIFNKYIDKIFLPNVKINDEVVSGTFESDIVLAAIIKISLAILVSSVVL